jgi:hypothetical protein
MMEDALDMRVIAKIQHCANSGLIPGSDKFRTQVAALVE